MNPRTIRSAIIAAVLVAPAVARADDAPAPSTATARGDHPRPTRAERLEARLDALDKNKDGRVSRDEAAGDKFFEKHFDEIDANKDGFIDKAEVRAYLEAHRRRRTEEGSGSGKPRTDPAGDSGPPRNAGSRAS